MSEIFDVGNGTPGNFPTGTIKVTLTVNGSNKGQVEVSSTQTLGQFLKDKATYYGIKNFSAFADNDKLGTADAAKTMGSLNAAAINIVAKDARGTQGRAAIHKAEKRVLDCLYNFSTDSL